MPRAHTTEAPARAHREAGVLLHPTSLPGRYGIGDFGDELTAFLDWAASAGMRVWQVLPLNPPGYGSSPDGGGSFFSRHPPLPSPQPPLPAPLPPAPGPDPRSAVVPYRP